MIANSLDVPARAKAGLIHLSASAAVAVLAAALVFFLWYPAPYREISGGRDLFLIIIAVDVVMGPLITFAVFNRTKPRAELSRDIALVVVLQIAGLGYGLHAVALARPAVVALEVSRLRVVRAIDLDAADFGRAPPGVLAPSWWGPIVVAARTPKPEEKWESIERGLAGEDIGMRPEFWLPAAQTAAAFADAAMPIERLRTLNAKHVAKLDLAVAAIAGPRDIASLGYLPILARRTDWSALVDRNTGRIVGYVPFEGF